MIEAIDNWVRENVPGLNVCHVSAYPARKEIYPNRPLQRKDREALKRAGFEWCGRYWAKPWTKAELEAEEKRIGYVSNEKLLSRALQAICLAHDAVGARDWPALDGYVWFDAGKEISKRIPNDKWAIEFVSRSAYRRNGICPKCGSEDIQLNVHEDPECNACGWPQ